MWIFIDNGRMLISMNPEIGEAKFLKAFASNKPKV